MKESFAGYTSVRAMHTRDSNAITKILSHIASGDVAARQQLWNLVYQELRQMAADQMALESPGRTLQPTALVHEAYFRLCAAAGNGHFENRRHFFAAAARAMRQIRIDDARRRGRLKRGGPAHGGAARSQCRSDDNGEPAAFDDDPVELLAVEEALATLEKEQPDLAELVQLRFFAGLDIDQTAEVLGVAPRTVDNRWRIARAWLHRALGNA